MNHRGSGGHARRSRPDAVHVLAEHLGHGAIPDHADGGKVRREIEQHRLRGTNQCPDPAEEQIGDLRVARRLHQLVAGLKERFTKHFAKVYAAGGSICQTLRYEEIRK